MSPGSAIGPRILVLVENLSVPFDRRVWQECEALVEAGYRVEVICPEGTVQDTESFAEIAEVRIHRYALRPATGGPAGYVTEYGVALWRTLRIALRLQREGPIDVVHACNPPDLLFLIALVLRREGTRFLFDHHDLVPELFLSRFVGQPRILYRLALKLESVTFGLADYVISTNESYRAAAILRGHVPPDRVKVVRSAPDLSVFVPVEPDPDRKNGKPHLAVYLGVMGPQDGVDYALRALAHLRYAMGRDDVHSVFIGSGDCYDESVALCQELGLADVVTFTGRLPDEAVRGYLSTADVCLSPDPQNPLNDVSSMNKVVEYMAMGCPIVSFELTEARVTAGDAAAYAADNDPEHFGRLVAELLDDPARRARMGDVGRRRVAETLSWETSRRNLLESYEDVLRRPSRREERRSRKPKSSSSGQWSADARRSQNGDITDAAHSRGDGVGA